MVLSQMFIRSLNVMTFDKGGGNSKQDKLLNITN